MKKTELKRKTPLVAKKPMSRGVARMRAKKPVAYKPKRASREAEDRHLMDMCRGQDCYLAITGVCNHNRETVVACHSNQSLHGKGAGLKAHNRFTVPGCSACHAEIDQGKNFSKIEKFWIWDVAYERWMPVRENLLRGLLQ
jgi:hypothetical protein